MAVGEANAYTVNQVGIRLTGATGTGVTFAGGVTWDSKGNVGLYGSAGGATGVDLSVGIEFTGNTSYNSDFGITDLRGGSADSNFGGGIPAVGLDFSTGGNLSGGSSIFSKTGSLYNSKAIGISVSPIPASATRTFENMGVVKLF